MSSSPNQTVQIDNQTGAINRYVRTSPTSNWVFDGREKCSDCGGGGFITFKGNSCKRTPSPHTRQPIEATDKKPTMGEFANAISIVEAMKLKKLPIQPKGLAQIRRMMESSAICSIKGKRVATAGTFFPWDDNPISDITLLEEVEDYYEERGITFLDYETEIYWDTEE